MTSTDYSWTSLTSKCRRQKPQHEYVTEFKNKTTKPPAPASAERPLRYLLLDRDKKFPLASPGTREDGGTKAVLLPPKNPNLSAHVERNHQGWGNRPIEPSAEVGRVEGEAACRNRLGGLLRYHYREAA
jgi:hypothetical protein